MVRYLGDQSQVGFQYESGTYATATGASLQWLGVVTETNVTTEVGVESIRYVGAATRNVDIHVDGPLDIAGELTFHPQDWKSLIFALGSIVDAGSPSPYLHTIKELNSANANQFTSGTLNPFITFTIEDSKRGTATGEHFKKTVNGAMVDSWELSGDEGGVLEVNMSYIGQNVTFSSGAVTSVTAATTRPFLWQDVKIHIPSGTIVNEVRGFNVSINNNVQRAHYLNGSRVTEIPTPLNRDYEVSLNIDATNTRSIGYFENNYLSGTEFNMIVEVTDSGAGTGSRAMLMIMSGCKLTSMEDPTSAEEVQGNTLTIKPTSMVVTVDDTIEKYGAW